MGPRRPALLIALTIVAALTSTACTGWRNERLTPQLMEQQPHELRVTRSDGSRVVLVEPELQSDRIIGTYKLQPLAIPMDSVRQTATRGFSTGKTVGLVAILGGVLALTAALINSHD